MSDTRITPTQWRALIAAWLGWAFDGLDGYLYIMVATRFVTQLLGKEQPDAEVAEKAAIIQGFFLIGWAVGGAVFGRLGDRLGRSRTLTLTILTYALFTGLTFFATQWWHVLIFRFIAALGIGGEWAAGSTLVSETLHERHRSWASAALQSGYMIGCILAALTSDFMSHLAPKWVFVVGILPALVVLWIRRNVPEPHVWASAARMQESPPLSSLFSRELVGTTLLTTALTSIALTTVWAFLYFMPRTIERIPEVAAWPVAERARLVSNITIAYFVANIVGNFFATYLARFVGYRRAFSFFMLGSLACFTLGFHSPPTLNNAYFVACAAAFFSLGLFGMFPLYIPRLFPTLVRTLGAGFSYNAGRLVSGVGAFYGAWITAHAGGPHKAIFWTGLLYIPGLVVALFCPLPKYPLGDNDVH
jgi:MFS family permease